MKVIKINNCYYSVPSNEKTDLYTKVIPAIKGIFLTEDKVQILDKPIEGIKISIIKLEKVVNLLFDVTEILITKKDHVEQTLVIFKNIETQEIYGYYILPEGNKIFYNNSLTNLTREYYDEKLFFEEIINKNLSWIEISNTIEHIPIIENIKLNLSNRHTSTLLFDTLFAIKGMEEYWDVYGRIEKMSKKQLKEVLINLHYKKRTWNLKKKNIKRKILKIKFAKMF